jgi:hypothetical protein
MTISEDDLKNPVYWIRWSINSGLMTDQAKDSLYGYAYLTHQEVKSAEVSIDIATKKVMYDLYVSEQLYSAIGKYRRLMRSEGIISLWRVRRLMRRYGNLELGNVLADFVKKLCGNDWQTFVNIKSEVDYVDSKGDGKT